MKYMTNEKGLTLIELTIAVLLLSIVLLTFFGLFLQGSIFNTKNAKELKTVNLARYYLENYDLQGALEGKELDKVASNCPTKPSESVHYCQPLEAVMDTPIEKIDNSEPWIMVLDQPKVGYSGMQYYPLIVRVQLEDQLSETYSYLIKDD